MRALSSSRWRGSRAERRRWPIVAAVWLMLAAEVASANEERRSLPGSIAPTDAVWLGGQKAGIARTSLSAVQAGEEITVVVALEMRDFPSLLERLARGETISRGEMAGRYFPTAEAYDAVSAWVAAQGLKLEQRDPSRIGVFAAGSVARMAAAFQTGFVRVRTDEGEFSSAIAVPSIPANLPASVLGVVGLQPHLRVRGQGRMEKLSTSSYAPPYLPGQIARAYNADVVAESGAGQTIGIVIDTFPADSDLTTFWSICGVNQSLANLEKVQVVAGTLPAPSGEETLDVEWTSAIAPGARIRVYATRALSTAYVDAAYARILDDLPTRPGLRQLSLSYGLGETYMPPAQLALDAQYFASLAAAGVTVFVASGDGGSSPGPSGHDHSGPVQTLTPACDPSVTAVGGTTLTLDATTGDVVGESAWYDGGGGASIAFSRPSWQVGPGVPVGTTRLVPDIAAAADPGTGGFLVWNGGGYIVGGTSWSAPIWAGFAARVNQARAAAGLAPLGLLGPKLYPLSGSGELADIVAGSNGPDGIYDAGPGFDLCTGLGVPDVAALVLALTPMAPSISAQPTAIAIGAGRDAVFSVVADGRPPPTFRWQMSTDGVVWEDLADGPPYSGTTTATLTISSAAPAQSGCRFRCVVANAQGSVVSEAVTLTVQPAEAAAIPAMPTWAIALAAAGLATSSVGGLRGCGRARPVART